MTCPASKATTGTCPFNKSEDKTITPVILASHLATLNLIILVINYLDMTLVRLSLNTLMYGLIACLVAVQAKKFFNTQSAPKAQNSSNTCCSYDLSNPDSVGQLYSKLYTVINNAIQTFRKVVLLDDKLLTLQVVSALFIVSRFAKCLGDFGILALAANVVCIAPYVIQNHSEEIASVYQLVQSKANETLGPLLAKAGIKLKSD